MRMLDIIEKKRDGKELSEKEIRFFIDGYVKGDIPDYQASALCMAIVWRGMTTKETVILTDAMMHSGDIIDLSDIKGIKADKHSTGGVGDKTSLAVGPIVAACGGIVAKLSGRGLGHTGGTLDKLESIPGMSIAISEKDFKKQVSEIGLAIIGQTAELDPADKKLYALRDVTGCVPAIPLIASSIMSKKLATGSDAILLDVKVGDGAFMKDLESAKELTELMVEIGTHLGKKVAAELTNMDEPLGLAIGNSLEVKEAIDTLNGKGPKDFTELVLKASAKILIMSEIASSYEQAFKMIDEVIKNGKALQKFVEMVEHQHGDSSYIIHPEKFKVADYIIPVIADKEGYVSKIDCMAIGIAAMKLGAGRETMEDKIDPAAGIVLQKKYGDYVKTGDILAYAHTEKEGVESVISDIKDCFHLTEKEPEISPIILAEVG